MVLRRIREEERHETRQEFADAMIGAAVKLGEPVMASERYVARLEDGDIKWPHPPNRRVLAELCQRPFSELGFTRPAGRKRVAPVSCEEPETGSDPSPDSVGRQFLDTVAAASRLGEVSETLRRDFLGLSGSVAVGGMSALLESELNQIYSALSQGSGAEERVRYLEGRADDLGIMVAEMPPMSALGSAITALRSARALLEQRQPTRCQARLVAVNAKLSLIVGVEAFNAGHVELAAEWHKAAEYAAADADDGYLVDIAIAQQAFTPLYGGRPSRALSLVTARLESGSLSSPAVAQLWGIKARAHASLGEQEGFKRSIASGWGCLDNSESASVIPGILSFHPANLAFYETTGAVALNDLDNSLAAADRAMELFRATESYDQALVGLERASALAKAGEISEACRAAKTVMLATTTYYCAPVRTYARKFNETVRTSDDSDAREWRDLLREIEAGIT